MNEALKSWNEQIEKLGLGPARDAAKLGVDHLEQIVGLQLTAAQTFAETAMKEARAALSVSDAKDLQSYLQRQQSLAQEVAARVKADAEKAVALNQDFATKLQKLTEQNLAAVTKLAGAK